jgi:PDZ domain-containing protein
MDELWMRRAVRGIVFGSLAAVVLVAGLFVPIPVFFVYLPGPVRDVERLVEVSRARTYSSEGRLYLTTVSVDVSVTAADMVLAAFDGSRVIVLANKVTGGRSPEHLEEAQRKEMVASKRHARDVALAALGLGRPTGKGALVVDTAEGAPADGVLQPGDVITSVDGRPVRTTCDVGRAVVGAGIGSELRVRVRRAERFVDLTLRTTRAPSDPASAYIGVAMRDLDYELDPTVGVDFKTGRIAGPSAGLMFALGLYDRLTPEDLTGGRTIAGTGTIQCDGRVGAIGGIEQKVAAAERHGADIFLAPRASYESARSAAEAIEVVAVSSFDDAVDYLEASDA